MFTGLITHISGVLRHTPVANGLVLTFSRPKEWSDLALGESVATDGACLTVTAIRDHEYDCSLMSETLAKTTFGRAIPHRVNLERAISASGRFGGHFVQGHVDGVGEVTSVDKSDGYTVSIKFGPENTGLVMYKGSICVNGVSLTVAHVKDGILKVALIPHTLEHTTLGSLKAGSPVNLEFDVIGKYIENIMKGRQDHAKS